MRFRLAGARLAVIVEDAPGAPRAALSPAERQIAKLIAGGLSNAQIARVRGTSVLTVGNQVASLMRKLGAKSRVEVALACVREGSGEGEEG